MWKDKYTGIMQTTQFPSYVNDVLVYTSESDFPSTGVTGRIYIDKSTNKPYHWSGTDYVEIFASLALGDEFVDLGNDTDMSAFTKRHLPFTICKHCGAQLPKYDFYTTDFVKCEYCKSIYYYDTFDYN